MQTLTDILASANRIARKAAYKFGLSWQTLYGPAYEAVLKAQKSWRPGGKSLEDWAEGYLRATIRKERGCHKVYKGKAQYVSLDGEAFAADGDGMALHEAISQDSDGGATEDRLIQGLRVKDALRVRAGMSPRMRAIVDAEIEGVGVEEAGENLAGKVYTAARVSQLGKGIPQRVAAEGPQLALSIPQLNKAQGAPVKSCFGIPAEQVERPRRRGARVNGAAASQQMSMF